MRLAGIQCYPQMKSKVEELIKKYWWLAEHLREFDMMSFQDVYIGYEYFQRNILQRLTDWCLLSYDYLFEKPTHENAKYKEELFMFLKNAKRLPYFVENNQSKRLLKRMLKEREKESESMKRF